MNIAWGIGFRHPQPSSGKATGDGPRPAECPSWPRRQPTAALGPLLNPGGKPQPPVMSDRAATEARYTCPAATGPAPSHGSASAATLATPGYAARYVRSPGQSGHIKIP